MYHPSQSERKRVTRILGTKQERFEWDKTAIGRLGSQVSLYDPWWLSLNDEEKLLSVIDYPNNRVPILSTESFYVLHVFLANKGAKMWPECAELFGSSKTLYISIGGGISMKGISTSHCAENEEESGSRDGPGKEALFQRARGLLMDHDNLHFYTSGMKRASAVGTWHWAWSQVLLNSTQLLSPPWQLVCDGLVKMVS